MRIVFMGTPEIAATVLRAVAGAQHEIACVYTRADKPVGRRQVLTPPPVKQAALELGLPVRQPKTLRRPEAAEELATLEPDIVVVVAYGLILPPQVLAVPRLGCVNLHVSLLPQYRGAAPVQWAIIHGETQTGVSLMCMDEGIDTGPVLAQKSFAIGPEETSGQVLALSAQHGAALLLESLPLLQAGTLGPVAQKGQASHAPVLTKEAARLNFNGGAAQAHNLVRGCNPWPLAWFVSGGKRIKLLTTAVTTKTNENPGVILSLKPLTVACGQGALVLHQLIPEGSRQMDGSQWAMGRRLKAGENLLGKLDLE